MTTSSRTYDYDLSPDLEPDPDAPVAPSVQPRIVTRPVPTPRREHVIQSPIDRRMLRYFSPIFWFVLALLAGGVSAISTVTQVGVVIQRMKLEMAVPAVLAIGSVIALLIFLGELFTSADAPKAYFVILMIDVGFTLTWSWRAFYNLAESFGVGHVVALGFSLVVGGIISVFCAWLPERVLLGMRRGDL